MTVNVKELRKLAQQAAATKSIVAFTDGSFNSANHSGVVVMSASVAFELLDLLDMQKTALDHLHTEQDRAKTITRDITQKLDALRSLIGDDLSAFMEKGAK